MTILTAMLTRRLKADGWSTYAIALEFGISQPYVSQIVNGVVFNGTPGYWNPYEWYWYIRDFNQKIEASTRRLTHAEWELANARRSYVLFQRAVTRL